MTMDSANIQDLISGEGFIMVNKGLAKAFGLVPAAIYGELVSTFSYWKNRNMLTVVDGKEWFFCTIEDMEDKTSVKKDAQSKAIKTLEKEGLLITKRIGLPAKRYFHITDKYINTLIGNYFSGKPQTDTYNVPDGADKEEPHTYQITGKPQTGLLESRKLDYWKTDTNKKALNNKQINKDDDDKRTSPHVHKNNIQDATNEITADVAPAEDTEAIIIELRESTKDDLKTGSFNSVVKKVMDMYVQGKIGHGNFRNYLMTALTGRMQELEERRKQDKAIQPKKSYSPKHVRTTVEPDWLDSRNKKSNAVAFPASNIDAERQKLLKELGIEQDGQQQ